MAKATKILMQMRGLALAILLVPASSWAQLPNPLNCVNSQFQQQVGPFTRLNPEEECKLNGPAKCDEGPENLMVPGKGKSLCKNMYHHIRRAAETYKRDYEQRCNALNAKLAECKRKKSGSSEQFGCLHQHHDQLISAEDAIAELLMENRRKLQRLEQLADEARRKYRDLKVARQRTGIGPVPQRWPGDSPFLEDRALNECVGRLGPNRWGNDIFHVDNGTPNSEGRIIDEQTKAITTASSFRDIAFTAADEHQKRARDFRPLSQQMADLERRMRTADLPPDTKKQPENKSDITGTDQKPPQQQAGGPQGGGPQGGGSGGGSGGGPSGSGPATGFDQGGGSNASTPPSLNNGTTPKDLTGNKPIKVAGNTPASGSTTGEAMIPKVPDSNLTSSGGTGLGSLGNASRGLASTGKGNGSTSANSSAPGGGGIGGGGGGGTAVPCHGKDCQQAMSATGGQFAASGTLGGGGGGGFGAEDTSSALDNLFKSDDEKKSGEGPGGDALASLDGDVGLSEGADLDGDLQGAEGGGEIGRADGGDLFERVRGMHTRAQKKGLVAGMLKKL